jgi:hypothetical protein
MGNYNFPNNFGGYLFPWQLPQQPQPQAQAAAAFNANPVNANIDAIWAGGYPRSMFAPQPSQAAQPQQSQITPQAQAFLNLSPQGGDSMPDNYSLGGLLSGMGGDDGSEASVTGGPTAAYTPVQGSQGGGSKYAQQRMSADADTPNDAPANANTVAAPNIQPDLGSLNASAPQHWQGEGALGGTYDGDTGSTSWLNGAVTYNPNGNPDSNNLGMTAAAIKDAALWFGGNGSRADNVQNEAANQLQMQQMQRGLAARSAIAQQLQEANGDPVKTRAALVNASLLGLDPGEISGALGYGTPQYKNYDRDQNVYAIDPTTGRPLAVLQKGVEKPVVSGGMIVQPDAGTSKPIPGYLGQQLQIASAKARARAEANAEYKTSGANAPINIAHPSTGY